jgi:hypothetical protein
MVDVQVASQLQQWSFDKTAVSRPERSDSSASSPDLSNTDSETLRIDAAAQNMVSKERASFHERYLSSEEDLSPMDGNSSEEDDSDISIYEIKQCFQARKMSVSKWDKGKSCDMAVTVSYVLAGRPKVIDLATLGSPVRETVQRPASMHQPPVTTVVDLDDRKRNQVRHSMMPTSTSTTRSNSPAITIDSRRPATSRSPYAHSNKSALNVSDSASSYAGSSTRSTSPSMSEKSTASNRPASTAAPLPLARRSSLYLLSSANRASTMGPMPPLTPHSPGPHAFLSSDPYESSTVGSASPIIKSPPHKRLRSISQRLSLAKIAITPSTRKWDSRINGKPVNMPLTPASPYSPMTPQTAPPTSSTSPLKKLQRHSRMMTRTPTQSSYEQPSVTIMAAPPTRRFASERMVARAADEREPMLELPPFPENDTANNSIKSRKIRKRKSLMDLL